MGKRIVHTLKYGGYLRVVEKLAVPMMREAVAGDFDVVVPVPLHRSRLRRRGFNQAKLLATGLAEKIKTPVSDRLEAVRRTRDQVELSAAGRRANERGGRSPGAGLARGRRLYDGCDAERLRR